MRIHRGKRYRALTVTLIALSMLGQACTLSLIKWPDRKSVV